MPSPLVQKYVDQAQYLFDHAQIHMQLFMQNFTFDRNKKILERVQNTLNMAK